MIKDGQAREDIAAIKVAVRNINDSLQSGNEHFKRVDERLLDVDKKLAKIMTWGAIGAGALGTAVSIVGVFM